MSYFLNLALVPSILLFLVFGLALFTMTYWVLCLFARFARTDALVIPLGAFIGTIATSWALSLGFVAADIWTLHAKADQELTSERSAINRLIGNAEAEVLNRPDLEAAMEFYREKVISDEWGANGNLHPAASVEQALQKIRIIIMDIAEGDAPAPIINQTVAIFNDLQETRDVRLAIASTTVNQYKWYMLLTLTILTSLTIAVTHADRTRAGSIAIFLYVLAATTSLWLLTVHASPYAGIETIEPSGLYLNLT
ncbi:DUF4239 domain-containing protein [Martelella mediterranea]|uniref:DUF4239 domain-containing protein n=1 Tax=Martelella mediterranea DSM 17316 TaxID=1122214 RepID=A0A1U9Z0B0_9HYPH|nr:DUF4239 domain-containing protein [Martelella mediterranea]AQZ51136.1 hypothetical protein Mame_01792 [Martelella mediterranea DSM 17316]